MSLHDGLLLAARIVVGATFLGNGLRLTQAVEPMTGLLSSKGMPFPRLLALAGVAFEIIGGALILAGMWVPAVALAAALFVVAATLMVHDFWNAEGMQLVLEINCVLTNLLVVGGLLALAAATL